jgi:hypothetical protein
MDLGPNQMFNNNCDISSYEFPLHLFEIKFDNNFN